MCSVLSGCSAFVLTDTKTIEHKLEALSRIPKTEYEPIDLRLLGQTPPPEHLVGDGDVLGIYIEGGPGQEPGEMPVRFPDDRNVAPAIGYPMPVRNGGYVRVPEVGLLFVNGMTIWQIEERIRQILVHEKKSHQPDKTQIHVSLMWTRSVDIMVIRQEENDATKLVAPSTGSDLDRSSGQVVQLPAFRNDVLNALLETGGLPSNEAENSVYIFKRNDRKVAGRQGLPTGMVPTEQLGYRDSNFTTNALRKVVKSSTNGLQQAAHISTVNSSPSTPTKAMQKPMGAVSHAGGHSFKFSRNNKSNTGVQPVGYQQQSLLQPIPDAISGSMMPFASSGLPTDAVLGSSAYNPLSRPAADPNSRHPHAIRIPLTIAPSQGLNVSESDVVLQSGDIVVVESRNDEVFVTGGLLGGGQYSLPRDRDIDVIDAVLLADTYSRSSQINQPTRAIGGVSVLNRDVTVGASRVVVERKLPSGETHLFRVNLYKAMRDPSQRILIEPGDRLFLEYTLPESIFAFAERHLFDPFTNGLPTVIGVR
ncbi:MAG: polysaccharide biosynthesis/export family protein [Fuerstiella sp.]